MTLLSSQPWDTWRASRSEGKASVGLAGGSCWGCLWKVCQAFGYELASWSCASPVVASIGVVKPQGPGVVSAGLTDTFVT